MEDELLEGNIAAPRLLGSCILTDYSLSGSSWGEEGLPPPGAPLTWESDTASNRRTTRRRGGGSINLICLGGHWEGEEALGEILCYCREEEASPSEEGSISSCRLSAAIPAACLRRN